MEFIQQPQKAQNKAEVLKVKEEIAGTKAKREIYRCLEEQAEDQSNTSDDREDRLTAAVAKCNLGLRSRSKKVEALKPMSIKEDYMSKPQVIPATVKKMGRKTTLARTYEPGVQKSCWHQRNEEGKATLAG